MQKEAVNINCPNALIFQTGIGGSNVIKSLQKLRVNSDDKIINVGYVGSTCYKTGEIKSVHLSEKLYPSITIKEPARHIKPIDGLEAAVCYTADNFYENKDRKDVPLVDMELYYISLILPQVQSIKIVSDNAHYQSYKMFNAPKAWEQVNNMLKEMEC
jgi:hypothetical protein